MSTEKQIELMYAQFQKEQKGFSHIAPAQEMKKEAYAKSLEAVAKLRGAPLYYPYLGSGRGEGPFVELNDGSVKYDMVTGIGVHYCGHSHPKMIKAQIEAALSDTIMQGHLQQNMISKEVMDGFLRLANSDKQIFDHCFLSTSGVMANENALKIIFQKKSPEHRILAFEHCFAGRTLAVAQITDKAPGKLGLPQTLNVDYIPFYNPASPDTSLDETLKALHMHLQTHPGEYAAMVFELIQGEGGYNVGESIFFKEIMAVLKSKNIAVLVDEVQTFGRTAKAFAFQYFDLEDYIDIVTVGKMSQVCATLYPQRFAPEAGLLSQTFTGSTSALYGAHALFQIFEDESIFGEQGKNMHVYRIFEKQLIYLAKKYPGHFEGPYGLGAMVAFTLWQGKSKQNQKFLQVLFQKGVIAFCTGGEKMRIRFLPPVPVLTEIHIKEIMDIVEHVFCEIDREG